jgi:hypothetical protein
MNSISEDSRVPDDVFANSSAEKSLGEYQFLIFLWKETMY